MENIVMNSNANKIEILPKKKMATGFIGYIPTILLLSFVVFIIISLFELFGNKDILRFVIFLGIAVVLYLLVYIMSFTLDWFMRGTLTYNKEKSILEYVEYGVLAIGSDKSTYKMKKVDKIKKKNNSVWLYGEIEAVEGWHKTKLKRLELKAYDKVDDVYKLVKKFKEKTDKSYGF